MTDSGKNM